MLQQVQYLTKESANNNYIAKNITIWHLCIFLSVLPFDRMYSELTLFSFSFHVLIHLNKHKLKNFTTDTILLTSIFLFTLIGSIYSSDRREAMSFVERQLAFLIFPVLLTLERNTIRNARNVILNVFSWSIFILVCILFIRVFFIIYTAGLGPRYIWDDHFTNHNFSSVIDLHATYFSLYLFVSTIFFIEKFFVVKYKWYKVLYSIILAICALGLIQLASRSVSIALIIILLFLVPFYFMNGKRRTVFLSLSLGVTSFVLISIYNVPALKERFFTDFKKDLSTGISEGMPVEPRAVRWECALDIFYKSPIWGHGSGDEKKTLMDEYYNKKLYISYVNKLDAHNQYLSYMIKGGMIGLFIFILYLSAGYFRALRNHDFEFLSFLILITAVSFSENVFSNNKGIFFIAFFYSFFWLSNKNPILDKQFD